MDSPVDLEELALEIQLMNESEVEHLLRQLMQEYKRRQLH